MNELKPGTVFKHNGEPFMVVKADHLAMGRGGAVVRTKAKGLISKKVLELSYKHGDKVEEADLAHTQAQFLYHDDASYYFMDISSYEQFSLSALALGEQSKFLKEEQKVEVLNFEGQPVSIKLPPKVELKVTEAPPGIRGDTAQGATKLVTLETGCQITVPLFIKAGEIIRLNTETGEYVERVK